MLLRDLVDVARERLRAAALAIVEPAVDPIDDPIDESLQHAAIIDIVREVTRCLPLPELLSLICRRTVEAFGVERVTVFDYHHRSRGYVPLADFGTPMHVVERFIQKPYTAGNTPHRDEILAGKTVLISRRHRPGPEDVSLLDRSDLHSLAMVPLRAENTTSGMLSVGATAAHTLTPAKIRGLEVIAHHAATAIAQARALRASEKAARFRAAVSTLAVELAAETSRAQALDLLCARGRAMFRASAAALLVATGNDQLTAVAVDGDPAPAPDTLAIALSIDHHPAVRAFTTGQVVRVDELYPGPHGLRSALAIPLVGGSEVASVLLIGDGRHRRHFDAAMVEGARVLGALAATALRNLDLMVRLRDTNAELRRVSSAKDLLLANVSHDLRTPLNIIVGYGQLAQEGTFGLVSDELHEVLGRMVTSAREQLTLVEDLLDLSRIELDHLTVRPGSIRLAPLFADLEFVLAGMLRGTQVQGIVRPVAADLTVYADPDRVRQILANLLGNAAKFTESGTIELAAERQGDVVTIHVRDTGRGIAPEEHERIFEPFLQVEGASTTLGAGLGLAIARRLSVLMSGMLTVESALGAGSTFRLTLPITG